MQYHYVVLDRIHLQKLFDLQIEKTVLQIYLRCNVLCFDSEIDQVIAAIQGNRIESFMIIRGISDYHDGTLNKEWQSYSSLCAASFMKTIIYTIPKDFYSHSNSEHDDDDDDIL